MEDNFILSEKIENWIKNCDIDNRKICFEFLDSDAIELENILKEFIKILKSKRNNGDFVKFSDILKYAGWRFE